MMTITVMPVTARISAAIMFMIVVSFDTRFLTSSVLLPSVAHQLGG